MVLNQNNTNPTFFSCQKVYLYLYLYLFIIKMSDDVQNHFQIELVSQTEIVNSNKQLKCIASLIYTD